MLRGLAHLVAESDVNRVVGQFECLTRKSLFIPVGGQGSHGARGLQRLLIYDWRSASWRGGGVRLCRLTSENQAHGSRQHQGQQPQSDDPLMSFHPHIAS